MSVFVDRKFEELDWISQATEPIDSVLNVIMGSIPDEFEITFEEYVTIIGEGWNNGLSTTRVVNYLLSKYYDADSRLSWDQSSMINKCFRFEIVGEPIIDFKDETITNGKLILVKSTPNIDEKDLQKTLGLEGLDHVRKMYSHNVSAGRANEILELLGNCDDGLRSRSPRKKKEYLYHRLRTLFEKNEWNIKDTELANKVGRWIAAYVLNGDLSALSNFCRLKVMTHKGQPIYSMEEVP